MHEMLQNDDRIVNIVLIYLFFEDINKVHPVDA